MAKFVLPRGALLNTATVAVGALIGLAFGAAIPLAYKDTCVNALGIITVGIGMKMFFASKNIIIVAISIVLGGMLGLLLGLHNGVLAFADWAKTHFGGGGSGNSFQEVLILTSVLFCVGPMTILGCLQDGLENKIELLAIKSTMDGLVAIFFAAAKGSGVLVTAGVVLVVESALTFLAVPLRPLANDAEMLGELSATGGVMLMGIGLGLLQLKEIPVENYLPALVLAPLCVWIWRRFKPAGVPA